MDNHQPKFFNISGVCHPAKHYMLPVLDRLPNLDLMIENEFYFVIHAPRQSGKTTFLKALTEKINNDGKYCAINCSLAQLNGIEDVATSIDIIIDKLNFALNISRIQSLKSLAYQIEIPQSRPETKILNFLNYLCLNIEKDLVIFFDEADTITGQAVFTFLTQIREGYLIRHSSDDFKFPRSLALIGMRNIKDYKARTGSDGRSTISSSPFNVIQEAFTLPNFTLDEIRLLYNQHTEATGQIFNLGAIETSWDWTEGQPWLVNALASEVVVKMLNNDYSINITADHIDQAAETLIKRRDTHIDSLLERLTEPRVVKVMDGVFSGTASNVPFNSDDRTYCIDLGLVVPNEVGKLRPANKIYREVMSRIVSDDLQFVLNDYVKRTNWTDGKILLMSDLLKEYQKFYRENADSFLFRYNFLPVYKYDEATYTFFLQSYLQRVINSDGLLFRNFSEGRKVVDLIAKYKNHNYLIEIKLEYRDKDESLKQLASYLDIAGENEGWLVIFDRDKTKSWNEKIYWETIQFKGHNIHIVGC